MTERNRLVDWFLLLSFIRGKYSRPLSLSCHLFFFRFLLNLDSPSTDIVESWPASCHPFLSCSLLILLPLHYVKPTTEYACLALTLLPPSPLPGPPYVYPRIPLAAPDGQGPVYSSLHIKLKDNETIKLTHYLTRAQVMWSCCLSWTPSTSASSSPPSLSASSGTLPLQVPAEGDAGTQGCQNSIIHGKLKPRLKWFWRQI